MIRRIRTNRGRPNQKRANPKHIFIGLFCVIFASLVVLFCFGVFGNSAEDNISLVVSRSDGNAEILVFDTINSEIVYMFVPGTTELDAAYNLGRWKIQSIPKLGDQEKIGGGNLLVKSIAKSMSFPVYYWARSDDFEGVANGNIKKIFKLFVYLNSNLSFRNKFRVAELSLRVPNSKRMMLDLSKNTYLKRVVLPDGGDGYVITNNFPKRYYSYFLSQDLVDNKPKIVINNFTGAESSAESVSKIIEVMGAKALYVYQKEKNNKSGCEVRSKEKSIAELFTKTLGCKYRRLDDKESSLIEIDLNSGFGAMW